MNYLIHNISINLNRIRKAKGMRLDVVAEQTGMSKSMLAGIERGTANPSIGVIDKILSGLRIELADLTQAPVRDAYLVNVENIAPTKDVPGDIIPLIAIQRQRARALRSRRFPSSRTMRAITSLRSSATNSFRTMPSSMPTF